MKTGQKIVKVCIENCDAKIYTTMVKHKKKHFCCEKGYLKSLADFNKFINNNFVIPESN